MNIRNFVIIAHVDHGKSTLADRFLELTGAVDLRQMKPQYLDQLELERERGITIKMAPVRMMYAPKAKDITQTVYVLNLIDTPGHSDFAYEVSRALAAVEGAILLVDATQGIQAQTLANLESAKRAGLKIIGAVNKIDAAFSEQIENSVNKLANLLGVKPNEIFKISGKTGEGAEELLKAIIHFIPSPNEVMPIFRAGRRGALIFDSLYDEHKGVIAFVRIFKGEYKAGDETKLVAVNEKFKIKEIGCFFPRLKAVKKLSAGEIGYIATGIKDPNKLKIGDTIGEEALAGYKEPKPVVFASLYPNEDSQYEDLKIALQKLKLNDSSLLFFPDNNEVLGRGFRCGFLGKLHFEIAAERLEKEFNIKTVSTFPSVAYKIRLKDKEKIIENPDDLPTNYLGIFEPTIKIEILVSIKHLSNVLRLKEIFRMEEVMTENFEDRILIKAKMPLSSLIADFDDKLKSVSEGMASFSYELSIYQKADVKKMEILINGFPVPGLTRFIYKDELEIKSRKTLEKLKEILPRQQFGQALQARMEGRIIARENIPALKKDVTGYLYGGDRTRKMKLWKKQKKGKKKLLQMASDVRIPVKVFKELLK